MEAIPLEEAEEEAILLEKAEKEATPEEAEEEVTHPEEEANPPTKDNKTHLLTRQTERYWELPPSPSLETEPGLKNSWMRSKITSCSTTSSLRTTPPSLGSPTPSLSSKDLK